MEKESKPKIIPEEKPKVDSIPIPDLLNDDDSSPLDSLTILPLSSLGAHSGLLQDFKIDEKSSRQKGLEELDLLGESLLKQHLPEKRSPQFEKKKSEKLSLNVLQQKQKQKDLTTAELPDLTSEVIQESSKKAKEKTTPSPSSSTAIVETPRLPISESEKVQIKVELLPNASALPITPPTESTSTACHQQTNGNSNSNHIPAAQAIEKEVKLADLHVPLSSIKPGHTPPLTLQESDDGISIVLHFGQDQPREHVTAIVVTVINKLSEGLFTIFFLCPGRPKNSSNPMNQFHEFFYEYLRNGTQSIQKNP